MPNRNTYSLTRSFGDLKVRFKLIVLHNLFFLVLSSSAYFSLIPLFEQQVAVGRTREVAAADPAYREAVFRAKVTLFLVLGAIYVAAVVLLEAAIMPLYVYRPLRVMLDADTATRAGDRQRELIPPAEISADEIGQIMESRNETVAELRRQEDELATALRRLEDQDRLVSLGLLSASVAHELNTPLAVLHGSVEKLIETANDAPTMERLARVQRVTERLQTISESLLDFAKARSQKSEPVPVRELIDDAWDPGGDRRPRRRHRVHQSRRTGSAGGREPRPPCSGIRQPIPQRDERIRGFAYGPRGSPHAKPPPRRPQGLAIAVEDNGPGIPPEVLPEIFDALRDHPPGRPRHRPRPNGGARHRHPTRRRDHRQQSKGRRRVFRGVAAGVRRL